jgi:hypothetical protein
MPAHALPTRRYADLRLGKLLQLRNARKRVRFAYSGYFAVLFVEKAIESVCDHCSVAICRKLCTVITSVRNMTLLIDLNTQSSWGGRVGSCRVGRPRRSRSPGGEDYDYDFNWERQDGLLTPEHFKFEISYFKGEKGRRCGDALPKTRIGSPGGHVRSAGLDPDPVVGGATRDTADLEVCASVPGRCGC